MKMKRVLLIVALFAASIKLSAQYNPDSKSDSDSDPELPKFYLGVGTGFNSYTGLLGISGNLRIQNKWFVQGGLGLGVWGYKASLGMRYDMNYKKGWSYGVGFSSNTGLADFRTDLELQSGETVEVLLDLQQAYTLNLKAAYNWQVGQDNTFYLEFGPAIPLQSTPWKIKDGSELSSTSEQVLEILSPGGLIFGLGFTFGL